MTKGSTWNIWDFHVHTPHSVLNNNFGSPELDETWNTYVDSLEKEAEKRNIVALGITDYFTIEGYKRLRQIQAAGRLQNVLLIPNIEFRVDKVIYRTKEGGEPKRINLHVLFSPEVSEREIEEGFLHDLDFVYENDPFESPRTRKLKIFNLTEFGEALQKQHAAFKERSPLHVGCLTAVVQTEQIKHLLENRFKGRYLLVLANENLELMNWDSQDHAVRKHLIQMSHAIFSSFEKDREFGLGKKHESVDSFVNEFKSQKPCLWGCDSHGYKERFLEPDGKRYCWIKGEATWLGLTQVLYEPENRVRVQELSPEPNKSIYTLSKIEVTGTQVNSTLSVEAISTELNPNLVTIIGGRGSGKTALLDIIATCFQEGKKLENMKNAFFYRLYCDEEKKHETSHPIPTTIQFRLGETYHKEVGDLSTESFFEKADIIYLTQNHFEEYTENPDKLYRHIIDLVFDRNPDERQQFNEMEFRVSEYGKNIQEVNLEIQQIREDIDGKREAEESSQKIKDGEKLDYLQRITEIEEKEGKSDDTIRALTERLESLRERRRDLESLGFELDEFSERVNEFYSQYKLDISNLHSRFSELPDVMLVNFPLELRDFENVSEVVSNNKETISSSLSSNQTELASANKEIDELEGVSQYIANLRQSVGDINSEIQAIESRIEDITEKENRILLLEERRINLYVESIKAVINLKTFLQQMISKFEDGKDEMLSRLGFSAHVDTRQSRGLIESLTDKINNKSHSGDELTSALFPVFESIRNLMDNEDTEANFQDLVKQICEFAKTLKLKKATSESDLFNTILKPFFSIGLKVEFNKKPLSALSMGERAIVLMKILLSLDDKPLLIDQPEEHLDNRYIYDELMPAFRSAKTKRQIIIATHNANLVVNTDAEQILIAENNNGNLSYKIGSLESIEIRDSIKRILEGGDEAFKKREEKYGLKF